ncbi:MAG: XamI family restriction endonuclease [Alphaproteobacteria bacterium]|nr:XamI family restriction endonuclease [Alphaproteobacteria bacterium]
MSGRQEEGPAAFYVTWEAVEPNIRSAFKATKNLRQIDGASLVADKHLWQILRYVCAPRISEEDLWTLVGKKFKTVPAAFSDAAAKTFSSLIDMKRFPWVIAGRDPTDAELEASIIATATLQAHEALSTSRRGSASKSQELQVSEALGAAGWTLDNSRSPVVSLDEIQRGHFSCERKVGGAKCDIPIRLNDGRLLALECKVSNGPKNSWKRLQREVGGKADAWKQAYGSQVITGAVLAGVFDLKCLADAQNQQNVVLFWQHDLKPLVEFIQAK